ncbi:MULTISPECIES: winged helix-turn-helix domain-containing protein [unclassified Variovorax]|uniref:winged helix-turn-helix domain-containing protein n=1 Tax=unclassified Variovorax TaxID=663243 RepID=UPI003F44F552
MADALHILIVREALAPGDSWPAPDAAWAVAFAERGFVVHTAGDAVEARFMARRHGCALIVLDLAMSAVPEAVAHLRARTPVPLLVLAGRGSLQNRLAELAMGVDAYLAKPFALADLLAKVRALTAPGRLQAADRALEQARAHLQSHADTTAPLRLDDLVLDRRNGSCARSDIDLGLTTTEFALLSALLRQQGRVQTREQLLAQVWARHEDRSATVVEASICRLRCKLDDPFEAKLLHTVRGAGYVLERRARA